MKSILLGLAVVGTMSALSASAEASDLSVFLRGGSHRGHHVAQQNHARHMQELQHRAYDRELAHHQAHRYPMTRSQHGRLHNALNHEAYHDHLEHRAAHRTHAYQPRAYQPSYGIGVTSRYGHSSGRYGRSHHPRSGFSLSLGF